MVKLNLAKFDGGIIRYKEVSAREYARRISLWHDIVVGLTCGFLLISSMCSTILYLAVTR